eukprot:1349043-Amorphochlora_amoeboformis.AAC.1
MATNLLLLLVASTLRLGEGGSVIHLRTGKINTDEIDPIQEMEVGLQDEHSRLYLVNFKETTEVYIKRRGMHWGWLAKYDSNILLKQFRKERALYPESYMNISRNTSQTTRSSSLRIIHRSLKSKPFLTSPGVVLLRILLQNWSDIDELDASWRVQKGIQGVAHAQEG